MKRESFIFYRDWRDGLLSLPPKIKVELYDAIVSYALDGVPTEMTEQAERIFAFIRPKIERDFAKYATMCERNKINARNSGRPSKESAKTEKTESVSEKPKKPSGFLGLNENPVGFEEKQKKSQNHNKDNDKDNDKDMDKDNNIKEEINSSLETHVSDDIDFAQILAFINQCYQGKAIHQVRSLSDERKKMIRARVKKHGMETFYEVIEKSANSDFLNGENGKGWIATIDWVIKPTNFAKILDGNYDNRHGDKTSVRATEAYQAGNELQQDIFARIEAETNSPQRTVE